MLLRNSFISVFGEGIGVYLSMCCFFTFHGDFKTLYFEMWNVLAVCCNAMVLSTRIDLLKHGTCSRPR